MAEETPRKKTTGAEVDLFLLFLGALAFMFLVIPVVAGVGLFLAVRRFSVKRSEWAIVGAGAIIAVVLSRGIGSYSVWMVHLVFGPNRFAVPWLGVALLALAVAAAAGMAEGTAVGNRVGGHVMKLRGGGDVGGILPTAKEKGKVRVAHLPGAAPLTIAADVHSLEGDTKVGSRPFPIGTNKFGQPVTITEDEIRMHGLLFGSTGAGKSETIKAIAGGLLDLGWYGLILDLKEDAGTGGLRDWCETYAQYHATPYQELCLTDPNPLFWFNPLAGMGPDEARDTILSLQEFEAPYYKNLNEKQLSQLANMLYWAYQIDPVKFKYPTVYEMGRILSSPSLSNAAKPYVAVIKSQLPEVNAEEDFSTLLNAAKPYVEAAIGLGSRLTAIYDTQAGRTVLREGPGRALLDVTQSGLTYVGLDSQGKPDLTKVISSAMLQRLAVGASQRTTGRGLSQVKPRPRFLIVDEANWVDRTIVQNLLSRARGAGISMILATQGPMDWIDKHGDDFAKLGQNTNVVIIMSQGEPKSAEVCAEYLGKEEQLATTYQVRDGDTMDAGSVRSAIDYIVQPDDLRRLQIGEAIVRVGKPDHRLTWAQIRVRDPKVGAGR